MIDSLCDGLVIQEFMDNSPGAPGEFGRGLILVTYFDF